MTNPSNPDARRNWMAERWYAYGDQISVFGPEGQPKPDVGDLPKAGLDDKGLSERQKVFPVGPEDRSGHR